MKPIVVEVAPEIIEEYGDWSPPLQVRIVLEGDPPRYRIQLRHISAARTGGAE